MYYFSCKNNRISNENIANKSMYSISVDTIRFLTSNLKYFAKIKKRKNMASHGHHENVHKKQQLYEQFNCFIYF